MRTAISLRELDLSRFRPGMRVLDVGCGEGRQMEALRAAGVEVVGVDPSAAAVRACRERGLEAFAAAGESLPFPADSFDAVISRVVLPYTHEKQVVAEIARVLRPGGFVQLSCHGKGYHVYDVWGTRDWKRMVYACRTFANTLCYHALGVRLPGFLGDTLFQSRRALLDEFRRCGLMATAPPSHDGFLGLPVFLYFTAVKCRLVRSRLPQRAGGMA